MLDITTLKLAKEITIKLKHPLTGDFLGDTSVCCLSPTSTKYKAEIVKVAKRHQNKNGKTVEKMTDADIDNLINSSKDLIVDTVSSVVTDVKIMNGEQLMTVDEFKEFIKQEPYFWIAEQVKGELDKGLGFIES